MKKTYLLTPGPTPIPETVSSLFSRPVLHHRTPEFQALLNDVKKGLKTVFQTEQDVLVLTCSGTGAMDASVSNLFSPGDTVIVLNAGKFGERWTRIVQAYGMTVVEIKVDAGDTIEPVEVERALQTHPEAKAILFQASETSTGVLLPTKEICSLAQKANVLTVCDAITACGVFDLPMDRWGIDVLITGSQKALMIPPGLAMIALSDRAWRQVSQSRNPKFYLDLTRERKSQAKALTTWTPAISLIQGLQEGLRLILEEGLPNVFKRHERLAQATRNGVKALGLELFSKAPSPAVTAVKVPSLIPDGRAITRTLREKYGVTIAGGQEELEGKIIRLSHLGYCDRFDITTAFSALELALHDLGYPVEFGRGVGAVLKTFSEESHQ